MKIYRDFFSLNEDTLREIKKFRINYNMDAYSVVNNFDYYLYNLY